jgi:hypothetical protein
MFSPNEHDLLPALENLLRSRCGSIGTIYAAIKQRHAEEKRNPISEQELLVRIAKSFVKMNVRFLPNSTSEMFPKNKKPRFLRLKQEK